MMIALKRTDRGFTLLELLLSIGVLAVVMSGIYGLFDTWLQRAINRTAASDTLRVQQAAHDYVYANYSTFAGDALNTWINVPISALTTGNYLPASYVARNGFRQDILAYRRNVRTERINNAGTGLGTYIVSIEVLAISTDPVTGTLRVPNQRLLDAAQAGGPKMGVLSQIALSGTSFAGRITSLYKDWYFSYSAGDLPGYAATPDSLGGYLAAYDIVNAENTDVNENYLYRVTIDGRPDLNRMTTDLYMNGNSLEDASTMVADKVTVNGTAAFRGIAQGGSGSETSQALTLDQALRIDGTGQSRIDMYSDNCTVDGSRNISLPTGCNVKGGELQVIAQDRVNPVTGVPTTPAGDARMNISGNLTADGSVITDITEVAMGSTTLGTTALGNSTFQTANGDSLTATAKVIAPTTNVTGTTVNLEEMQTASMNLGTIPGGGGAVTIDGYLLSASVRPGGTNTVTAPDVELGNSATFTGQLTANTVDVSNTLFMTDIENAAIGGPQPYHDAVQNRNYTCSFRVITPGAPPIGKTYCEPIGTVDIVWPQGSPGAHTYRQTCQVNTTGYACNTWDETLGHLCLAQCRFTRDSDGMAVKASHGNPVCTFGAGVCLALP